MKKGVTEWANEIGRHLGYNFPTHITLPLYNAVKFADLAQLLLQNLSTAVMIFISILGKHSYTGIYITLINFYPLLKPLKVLESYF